jgi:glycosyltransferase involved in cell wall biosynthesis
MPTQLTSPLISVVMPVYNAAPYLAEAIESILTQTHQDFEFIIADDESTDDSPQIIRAYAERDARIRPLFLEHGHAKSGNACVAQAQGRWLARMDADDVALPERLAIQLAWLQQSQVEVGGASFVQLISCKRQTIWFPEQHQAIQHELLFRVGLLQPTMMLPTELAKAYPYREQSAHEDYEWQIRISQRHRLGNLPQVLLKHRCHPNQSHNRRKREYQADLRTYRQPHFFHLFPEATADDYAAFAKAPDRAACTSLAELQLAGQWLARLAQGQEPRSRDYMANRWYGICSRSSALGPDCYRLYRQMQPAFGVEARGRDRKLQIMCQLRFHPGSSGYRLLQALNTQLKRFGVGNF